MRSLRLLASTGAVAVLLLAQPLPARAATAPVGSAGGADCASAAEFASVAEGQTAKRVATLLGTHGAWVDYSASVEIRRYLKCEGGVPAVINFAKTPNGAPKVETWFWDATGVPMASRAMVRFDGGKTVACRVDVDATTTVVHAYWDGSGYRGDRGAGGLARVTSGIRLKDHLNTAAKAGAISKTITMNLSLTGYVYFMSGNSISAENQRIRPVATVPPC